MLIRQSGIKFALGLLIIFNIFYFVYLAYYSYVWHDESLVLLHLSGNRPEQLINYLFDGQIKSTEQLWQFQGVNSVKGFPDTLASLYTSSNYRSTSLLQFPLVFSKIIGQFLSSLKRIFSHYLAWYFMEFLPFSFDFI
jgi:hypothetical protein